MESRRSDLPERESILRRMSPWFAKAVVLLGAVLLVVIPAFVHRAQRTGVVKSRKGAMERILLALVSVSFFLPLVWIATPLFAFADYPLRGAQGIVGTLCVALGLYLLYRSHADLGENWSITLEVRQNHQLITNGIYRRVRHPMYLALLLYALGQMLVLPNWVAGPPYFIALGLLFALRIGPEERMMIEEFGSDYVAYRGTTRRFIPRIW